MARVSVQRQCSAMVGAYLELGGGIRRIGRKKLEHVDDAADSPGAHAIVLVLQQTRVRELLGDGHERVAMCLLLIYGAQLIQQRLQARQEVGHADLLSWPSDQRLLEAQLLDAILFLFMLRFLLLLLLFFWLFFFDYCLCGRLRGAISRGCARLMDPI
jgi:hypothetical protein